MITFLGLGVPLSFAYVWVGLGPRYFVGTYSQHLFIMCNLEYIHILMYSQFQTRYLL